MMLLLRGVVVVATALLSLSLSLSSLSLLLLLVLLLLLLVLPPSLSLVPTARSTQTCGDVAMVRCPTQLAADLVANGTADQPR